MASSRFAPDNLERWYYLPAVATQAAPTTTEITAGTELTNVIQSVSGFTFAGTAVAAGDIGDDFDKTVPGRTSAASSTLTIYMSSVAADPEGVILALLPYNTSGFILRFFPVSGAKVTPASAIKCQVWPVRVLSNAPKPPAQGTAAMADIGFAITAKPSLTAAVA